MRNFTLRISLNRTQPSQQVGLCSSGESQATLMFLLPIAPCPVLGMPQGQAVAPELTPHKPYSSNFPRSHCTGYLPLPGLLLGTEPLASARQTAHGTKGGVGIFKTAGDDLGAASLLILVFTLKQSLFRFSLFCF